MTSVRGTSKTYLLERLQRDQPELAERVVSGELTAHGAAVQAGFRKRMIQIAPTVEGLKRTIRKYLDHEEQRELAAWILKGNDDRH